MSGHPDQIRDLVPQATFRRARSAEAKAHRRAAILIAAEELTRRDGVRTVTLAKLGAAVGLGKSNVLRYFGTREEIFLELTIRQWREWVGTLIARIDTVRPLPEVVDLVSASLVERPLTCELFSQAFTNLEDNVSIEVALEFKRTRSTLIDTLAEHVAARQSVLNRAETRELLDAAVMLASAVWVVANPPPKVRSIYALDTELQHGRIVFATTYPRALAALAAGLPSLR
ncbi:TetR family transcriptional regulator [Dactylosporangium sp. NPDC005572]|uniref:TetR family transcriptional regulator n=1 Tax=Dactylosporangium sp. NPDC005572 TaxID=3156889 RepID=UPI0033A0529C